MCIRDRFNVEMKSSFCTYHQLWCRFLHHLKKKVGNKARFKSLIYNAYLTEEISDFCVVYFEENVDIKTRDLERNICPDVEENHDGQIPDVFSCNIGHASSERRIRYLNQCEYDASHVYVLSNCELTKEVKKGG